MSSKKFYICDIRKRLLFCSSINRYYLCKYVSNNLVLPFGLKKIYFYKLNSLKINFVKIRNRCIYTFRSRSIYFKFKLSRIQLREYIWKLLIPGVFHVTW